MTTHQDVEQYALFLKRKIMVSVATALIRFASKKKKTSQEYTIKFQHLYLQLNDNINPLLKQKLLTFFQENLIQKLNKTVPLQSLSSNTILRSGEDLKNTGTVHDIFDFIPATKTDALKKLKRLEKEMKASTDRNVQFIQAIITLKTMVDNKPNISTANLDSLLSIKDNEFDTRPPRTVLQVDGITKNTDEDSGVFLSESYHTNSIDIVPSNILKFIIHTSDTDELVLQSAKCVMKVIEYKIKYQPVKTFEFWRGALVEYAVPVLSILCYTNEEFFEIVYKFICSTLEDIWANEEIGNHEIHECKIHILGEFVKNQELCIELMKFESQKLESLLRKEKKRFYLSDKASYMLIFCNKLLDSFKILNVSNKQNSINTETHKQDITTLWKQKYLVEECPNDGKTDKKEVIRNLTQILERLLITYSNDCPLLTKPIVKCVSSIKMLNDISEDQLELLTKEI